MKKNQSKGNVFFLISLGLIVGSIACSKSIKTAEWQDITVNVQASQAIQTSHKLIVEKSGIQRIDLTLTNNGFEPATIKSIEIQIPIPVKIADDVKIAYGSSCMGQRPVFIHQVGDPVKKNYSYMYAMLRQSNKQYFMAGSLSWRTFMPVFTFENNQFVVRSSGEGKQLKPGESLQYEQIVVAQNPDWHHLLSTLGWAIAKENGIKKVKDVAFKGWSTWDYYAKIFSDIDIYENTELIKQLDPTALWATKEQLLSKWQLPAVYLW